MGNTDGMGDMDGQWGIWMEARDIDEMIDMDKIWGGGIG